ncbi:DUF4168 domain-containing protein [Halomonas binhaiensis]|uniref:DUF4168 domain-containing protein n=2 Tax=Halomonas binhaiensis TaxID=2562282 RepID=A0A5C1NNW3_9GAMM|nr:DUF4168 domain-containing protein [Halomonas binhaiensis]
MGTSSTTEAGAGTSMEGSMNSSDMAAGASTSAGVDAAATQDFSDEDLQKFADASSEVAGITQDYSQQLQAETDVEAQQALQVEANQKISEAVQSSGLDVNTFNSIGMAVQQDPELLQRVQSMVQR